MALSTTVLLVRHGITPTTGKVLPGRAPGLELASLGKTQARTVATYIGASESIAAVYASPLQRTRQTAAPIAKACGVSVTINRGLIECDFGEWTGERITKLAKKPEWQTVQRAPSQFTFPGGESFVAMQARIVETLSTLCATHPGQTIVAVSHADVIKAATAAALGTPLDLFQRIMINPCSVTSIRYSPKGPEVLSVNQTVAT